MKGDKIAREILIEHNLRLVVFLSKKYDNTMIDLEDLVSIGTIGLIKGVNTYKLDKNIKLATYASRCIDNEILMYLRKNKKRRTEISFEDEQKKQAQQQRRTYPQPDVIETLEEEPETNDDDDSDFFSSLRKRGF